MAQMVPVAASHITTLIQSGQARPAIRNLSDLPKHTHKSVQEKTLSDELEEMRGAERY